MSRFMSRDLGVDNAGHTVRPSSFPNKYDEDRANKNANEGSIIRTDLANRK